MPRKTPDPSTAQRMAGLLARFGGLLTSRQSEFASQHWLLGHSHAEIGRQHQVTRQAVFDTLKKVAATLEEYESKISGCNDSHPNHDTAMAISQAVDRLERLRRRVAGQGVIYSSDWIAREIEQIRAILANGHSGTGENRG